MAGLFGPERLDVSREPVYANGRHMTAQIWDTDRFQNEAAETRNLADAIERVHGETGPP